MNNDDIFSCVEDVVDEYDNHLKINNCKVHYKKEGDTNYSCY